MFDAILRCSLKAPSYPEWPCLSGLLLMTSSWVGSPIMAPSRDDFTVFIIMADNSNLSCKISVIEG